MRHLIQTYGTARGLGAVLAACEETSTSYAGPWIRGYNKNDAKKVSAAKSSSDRKKRSSETVEVDLKNPRLSKILNLLHDSTAEPAKQTDKERSVFEKQMKAYVDQRTLERHAWIKDKSVKHKLQMAAIRALPERLRLLAVQPDYSPYPLNRHFLFHSPPESYRDRSL
jgi:hypothetical protein